MSEKRCSAAVCRGRFQKARDFRLAVELVEAGALDGDDVTDSYVTLCVHAGIAAADVICCRLGVHHHGDNHDEAVAMLGRADRTLAGDLATLLRKKTASAYSDKAFSAADRKQARRAMDRLMSAAEQAIAA